MTTPTGPAPDRAAELAEAERYAVIEELTWPFWCNRRGQVDICNLTADQVTSRLRARWTHFTQGLPEFYLVLTVVDGELRLLMRGHTWLARERADHA